MKSVRLLCCTVFFAWLSWAGWQPAIGAVIQVDLDPNQVHLGVSLVQWNSLRFPLDATFSETNPFTVDFLFDAPEQLRITDVSGEGQDGFGSEGFGLGFEFGILVPHDTIWDFEFSLLDDTASVIHQSNQTITQVFSNSVSNIAVFAPLSDGSAVPPGATVVIAGIRVTFFDAFDANMQPTSIDIDRIFVGMWADQITVVPEPACVLLMLLGIFGIVVARKKSHLSVCNWPVLAVA